MQITKSTENPCEAHSVARFSWKRTERAQSTANPCGVNLWPDYLEKEQSTGNQRGTLSANFLDNHGEHSESVWGAICEFRCKSRRARQIRVRPTLWPDFLGKEQTEHRAQQIRVGSICGPIILKKNRAQGIRVGRYLSWRAQRIRVGRNLCISLRIMKSTAVADSSILF